MLTFKTCERLGFAHPEEMPISWRQFMEWQLFIALENVPPEERDLISDIPGQIDDLNRRKAEWLEKRAQRPLETEGGA